MPDPLTGDVAVHLAANLLMPWRVKALARASELSLQRWVTVLHGDRLGQAQALGRGVILAGMHFGAARLVPLMVARMDYAIAILAPLGYLAKMGVDNGGLVEILVLPEDDTLWLRPSLQACDRLRKNGLVGVVADGLQGSGGRERTFLGRRRRFHAGFAELAVRTGAVVVPVVARMTAAGRITIEFLPALADDPAVEREQRIETLLDQYLACLAEEWRHSPGAVLRRQFLAD